jgi:hypothetical protein
MLSSTVNICFGRSLVGCGEGGRNGVGVGRSSGVRDINGSVAVGSGEGLLPIVGRGVGTGYFALTSPPLPREINHATITPDTASTTTIAKIQGNALLRDSPRPRPS